MTHIYMPIDLAVHDRQGAVLVHGPIAPIYGKYLHQHTAPTRGKYMHEHMAPTRGKYLHEYMVPTYGKYIHVYSHLSRFQDLCPL